MLSGSKIEGIENMASRFSHIYSTLKKKPYDPLDHRRQDFNTDFLEFQRQISGLQVRISLVFGFCSENHILVYCLESVAQTMKLENAIVSLVNMVKSASGLLALLYLF